MVMEGSNGLQKDPIECLDKCPKCGSEKGLVSGYVAELKEKEIISEDSFPAGLGCWELQFMDLKKLGILQIPGAIRPFPVMRIFWEICAEEGCYTTYIRRVEFVQRGMVQQVGPPQKAGIGNKQ